MAERLFKEDCFLYGGRKESMKHCGSGSAQNMVMC